MSKKAVCISCFNEYPNRMRLVMEHLREKGYACTYITSDFEHIKKAHYTVELPDCIQIHARAYTKNLSVDRLLSHHLFARDTFREVARIAPDLVYVMVPPNSVADQSAKYKKSHPNVQLVLDIFDMWPETFPNSRAKQLLAWPFGKWGQLRNRALSQADVVATECALYHDVLSHHCSREKLQTLHLAKESVPQKPALAEGIDGISLCYLGSINNIIDIPRIGEIISKLPKPVQLHIIGDGERRQELIDTAEAAGAAVTFHGKVFAPEKKQEIFNRCHFGLNVMKSTVFVGLTLKSMDYFDGGLPIINTIQGDTWEFVENNPIGINYCENTDFAKQLQLPTTEDKQRIKAFFAQNFSVEAFRERIARILQTLL